MDESLSSPGWEDATEELLVLDNREQLQHNLIISNPAESLEQPLFF
jgi:hypothetical protein